MSIALDVATDGSLGNPVTSLTWSHVCTGSNLILFVTVFGDTNTADSPGNKITGVTYNGVSMTLIAKKSGPSVTDRWTYLFYLIAPATGTHNVVVSASSSIAIAGQSVSYTGAKQSGQPDAFTSSNASSVGSGVDFTTTLTTTIADNSWTILLTRNNLAAAVASTGSTVRVSSSNGLGTFDSNGVITPPGSKSMAVHATGISNWSTIMASFAPAVAGTALTGTITGGIKGSDIVAGGQTIILTLTGDTWVASGATFDAQRQNIINGLVSNQSFTHGWNNEVQAKINVSDVVRTSNTVVTITLDAETAYLIPSTETITVTVPGSALTLGLSSVASPTFTISPTSSFNIFGDEGMVS